MVGAAVGVSAVLESGFSATALGRLPLGRFAGTVFGAGIAVVVDIGTKGITEPTNGAGTDAIVGIGGMDVDWGVVILMGAVGTAGAAVAGDIGPTDGAGTDVVAVAEGMVDAWVVAEAGTDSINTGSAEDVVEDDADVSPPAAAEEEAVAD